MKIIEKCQLSDQLRVTILKEVAILRKIDHPAIMRLIEIYEDDANIFLVFDLFLGKDIRTRIAESNLICFDEKTISDIIWKLLHCLTHLADKKIFHRDIKLENIYFRSQNNPTDVCLANFFMADFIDTRGGKAVFKKCGTAGYIAPEIFS